MITEKQLKYFLEQAFNDDPSLIAYVIQHTATYLASYREHCKRLNDSDLRGFAEIAFPVMVEKMKAKRSFWKRVMRVDWLVAMFKRLHFNSEGQCVAIKMAWREYEKELQ